MNDDVVTKGGMKTGDLLRLIQHWDVHLKRGDVMLIVERVTSSYDDTGIGRTMLCLPQGATKTRKINDGYLGTYYEVVDVKEEKRKINKA